MNTSMHVYTSYMGGVATRIPGAGQSACEGCPPAAMTRPMQTCTQGHRSRAQAVKALSQSIPINFSRNDRNVGGRLAHQHGFGRLAAPGQAGDSDMVGGGPPSPARAAPVSGIHTYPISLSIRILHTYPNYPSYVSQLSYISCHLSHLSATRLCSG